jgi:hypothetical protein
VSEESLDTIRRNFGGPLHEFGCGQRTLPGAQRAAPAVLRSTAEKVRPVVTQNELPAQNQICDDDETGLLGSVPVLGGLF